MKRRSIILAIALVIILLGGILSVAVDNDFGRMHTQRLSSSLMRIENGFADGAGFEESKAQDHRIGCYREQR